MSVDFSVYDGTAAPLPDIKIPRGTTLLDRMSDQNHTDLLNYLMQRITYASRDRMIRLRRYASTDRLISTWQKLSPDDSKRILEEDNTGKAQAVSMNLPILSAHLEDMTAFFSEIFSATSRDFYAVPKKKESMPAHALADKMNRDSKARKYYKELTLGFRSLLKYNIGGFAVRWEGANGFGELSKPGNRIESIDMYNYIWDTSVLDVSKISTDAEFAARISVKNDMWVRKGARAGRLARIDRIIESDRQSNTGKRGAKYYKFPPIHVGLSIDGADDKTATGNTVNWESFGLGYAFEQETPINGHEVIEMYCWLNPDQFKLTENRVANGQVSEAGYELWKFTIIDSCEVAAAEPVTGEEGGDVPVQIPHYLGFFTVDDMKEAHRSIMEFLKPFQRFASFLYNIYVAGARKNIWGIKGYDPQMFDISKIEKGDVAGWLASKAPGRDVRSGIQTLDSNTGVDKTVEMLANNEQMMQKLFPSQALPSQVAGIDRAIKNQVAAVMQGVQRRLHMSAKVIDSDIFAPLRVQCYRNLVAGDGSDLSGLDEEAVAAVLGSGLQQLNKESVASEVKELLYAILQSKEIAPGVDLAGLMEYWSQMMDMPSGLDEFFKQAAPAAAGPVNPDGTPAAAAGPDSMSAAGLGGAAPVQVPLV